MAHIASLSMVWWLCPFHMWKVFSACRILEQGGSHARTNQVWAKAGLGCEVHKPREVRLDTWCPHRQPHFREHHRSDSGKLNSVIRSTLHAGQKGPASADRADPCSTLRSKWEGEREWVTWEVWGTCYKQEMYLRVCLASVDLERGIQPEYRIRADTQYYYRMRYFTLVDFPDTWNKPF